MTIFFSYVAGAVIGYLAGWFFYKIPIEKFEYEIRLAQVRDLALMMTDSPDKPACYKGANCPLNGGVGFDNHCNLSCPFIIGNKIAKICVGEYYEH